MTDRDLEIASYISQALAVEAGDLLRESWESSLKTKLKDLKDVVTKYDVEIEEHIVKVLSREFPDHGFLLEEHKDISEEAEYKWVIDPIDGTKYFAGQVPLFTVSIGLLKQENPILGTIYNPISHQLYSSYKGLEGLYKNDDLITKSNVISNRKPIISVDEGHIDALEQEDLIYTKDLYIKLTNNYHRWRAFGQGSLSLIWLCLGAVDAYLDITGFTKSMDVVAGLAILKSFGGCHDFIKLKSGKTHLIAAINVEALEKLKKILC